MTLGINIPEGSVTFTPRCLQTEMRPPSNGEHGYERSPAAEYQTRSGECSHATARIVPVYRSTLLTWIRLSWLKHTHDCRFPCQRTQEAYSLSAVLVHKASSVWSSYFCLERGALSR